MKTAFSSGWPDDSSLRGFLAPWRGARALEIPLTDRRGRALGNHGDTLMYCVYRQIAGDAGLNWVDTTGKPEILVLPPNGALLDVYLAPGLLRERLSMLPDLPLVIFPSSAHFRTLDPAMMFGSRKSPTLWLLREEASLLHLSQQWGSSLARAHVEFGLDHDVVASGHTRAAAILQSVLSSRRTSGPMLVAARLDLEAVELPDAAPTASNARRILIDAFKRLPLPLQRPIRRHSTRYRQSAANQELTRSLISLPQALLTVASEPNSRSVDISSPTLVSFEQYASAIKEANLVVTNRLHVALPSASIGNTTILIDSGYHKLRGVYERSLSKVPNIFFLERP